MVPKPEKLLFVYREDSAPSEAPNMFFIGYVEEGQLKLNNLKSNDMGELALNAHESGINEIPFYYPIETVHAINKHELGKYIRTATWDEIDKFNKRLIEYVRLYEK